MSGHHRECQGITKLGFPLESPLWNDEGWEYGKDAAQRIRILHPSHVTLGAIPSLGAGIRHSAPGITRSRVTQAHGKQDWHFPASEERGKQGWEDGKIPQLLRNPVQEGFNSQRIQGMASQGCFLDMEQFVGPHPQLLRFQRLPGMPKASPQLPKFFLTGLE